MTPERSIETTGDTVEEAIAKGLAQLGVGPLDVMVEVLEEPSRGVFGIGAHPAKVRLQLLSAPKPPPPPPRPEPAPEPIVLPTPPAREEPAPTPLAEAPRTEKRERPERTERPERSERRREQPRRAEADNFDFPDDSDSDAASLMSEDYEEVSQTDLDEEAQVGQVVLNELLEKMDIRATISVRRAKATREGEAVPFVLDVTGGDLTRLIGRRGDTLASLQYITRLITSRELQRRANLIVDIDGYKARRARMLRGLANRMADQAVEKSRTVTMEPMPPHERRIIHLALRERADVSTRSVGEGSGRKVTIVPNTEA
jgi:spoIIIJ-associated protein